MKADHFSRFGPNIDRICTALFDAAAEGLVLVDDRGKIQLANPRMEELFGYQETELIGRPIETLIPDHLRSSHRGHMQKYMGKPTRRSMGIGMDLLAQRKDGSTFPVEISLNYFESDDKTYVMALITDITLRKKADAAIEELNAERKLNVIKSRFVSMASHEFRTPLSTILTSLSLLMRYQDPGMEAKRQKHFDRIRSAVHNLTGILDDFLSLDKLETGKIESQPERFDIRELLDRIVSEMQALAKPGQNVTFTHDGNPQFINDPRLLRNILLNLMSNAIKYSGEDKNITVTSKLADGKLVVSVKDEGIGIPTNEQKHLFERFFRAHNAMNIQGTGLGLNIVQKYLALMKGDISFTSVENQGSTFTVRIPNHEKDTAD